jgi:hypothetical protein
MWGNDDDDLFSNSISQQDDLQRRHEVNALRIARIMLRIIFELAGSI